MSGSIPFDELDQQARNAAAKDRGGVGVSTFDNAPPAGGTKQDSIPFDELDRQAKEAKSVPTMTVTARRPGAPAAAPAAPGTEAPKPSGFWPNMGAAVAGGVAGALNVASDPFGYLVGKPVEALGNFVMDTVAPALGYGEQQPAHWSQRLDANGQPVPGQTNLHYQTPDEVRQADREANVAMERAPGTELITRGAHAVGLPAPQEVTSDSPTTRLVRAGVEGAIGGAILGPAGAGNTVRSILTQAAIGGTGAVAGEAAAQNLPPAYQEVGSLVGNIVGGHAANLGGAVGARAVERGRDYAGSLGMGRRETVVDPTTGQGFQRVGPAPQEGPSTVQATPWEQRKAAEMTAGSMNMSPTEAAAAIPANPSTVPGSVPTIGEVTGNPGQLIFERGILRNSGYGRETFNTREALNELARKSAISNLETPEFVEHAGNYFRALREDAQREADTARANVGTQTDLAASAAGVHGGLGTIQEAGQGMREGLQAIQRPAKTRLGQQYDLLNKDKNLAYDATPVADQVAKIRGEMIDATPLYPGEEKILDDAAGRRGVQDFDQMRLLQSAIAETKRGIRSDPKYGAESMAYRRMSQVEDAIGRSIDEAAARHLAEDASRNPPGQRIIDTLNEADRQANAGGTPPPPPSPNGAGVGPTVPGGSAAGTPGQGGAGAAPGAPNAGGAGGAPGGGRVAPSPSDFAAEATQHPNGSVARDAFERAAGTRGFNEEGAIRSIRWAQDHARPDLVDAIIAAQRKATGGRPAYNEALGRIEAAAGEQTANGGRAPQSLLDWIISKGGVRGDSDLTTMGADEYHHRAGGRLVNNGQRGNSLNTLREGAIAEGFLKADADDHALKNRIDDELRGNKVYRAHEQAEGDMHAQAAREQRLQEQAMLDARNQVQEAEHGLGQRMTPEQLAHAQLLVARDGIHPEEAVRDALRSDQDRLLDSHAQIDSMNLRPGVSPLARQAEAPLGTGRAEYLPPEKAGDLARLRREYAQYKETFRRGAVGEVLATGNEAGGFRIGAASAPAKLFAQGPAGATRADNLIQAAGSVEAAQRLLGDYPAILYRNTVINRPGGFTAAAHDRFMNAYAPVFEKFPELRRQFATIAEAQRTAETASVAARERLDDYENSAARFFLAKNGQEAPTNHAAIDKLINSPNPGLAARQLMQGAANEPAAVSGLRRNVIEWFLERARSANEAGTSGDTKLRENTVKMLAADPKVQAVMRAVLTPDQTRVIQDVAKDMMMGARAANASKVPGSPTTAADLIAHQERAQQGASDFVSTMAGEAAGRAAASTAGFHNGFASGIASIVGILGANKLRAMRAAGISNAERLAVEMANNPRLGRLVLEQAGQKPGSVAWARFQRRFLPTAIGAVANEEGNR
jgi:hypothetical protein